MEIQLLNWLNREEINLNHLLKFLIRIFFFFYILFALNSTIAIGKNKYWILFTDKNNVEFNPHTYFDNKAISRRLELNLPLFDYFDLPVNNTYIDSVSKYIDVIEDSRWINGIAVYANDEQISEIDFFEFIREIRPIVSKANTNYYKFDKELSLDKRELLEAQLDIMKGQLFTDNNIDGNGIRIAIFDAGFPDVDKSPVFKHLREEGRIVKTYDFVQDCENVYDYMQHGTMVLSCIAGRIDGEKLGLATGAEFLLARTERMLSEKVSEEENWLAAAEWADKNGVNIINSSLGYTDQRYFAKDMNGKTSIVAKAANIAASKGILVISAMGNDGNNRWKILSTPADADSVLSVGAIDPKTNFHSNFSSLGPTSDYRLKPNVCSYGKVLTSGKRKLKKMYGTSFATPLISGFAACVWQMNPDYSNMELFNEIEKSSSLYPYFDYAHGYGVPNANYFFKDSSFQAPTFEIVKENELITIYILDEYLTHSRNEENPYLYYHIQNNKGKLEKYAVVQVLKNNVISFDRNNFNNNEILRIFYKKYMLEYKFE